MPFVWFVVKFLLLFPVFCYRISSRATLCPRTTSSCWFVWFVVKYLLPHSPLPTPYSLLLFVLVRLVRGKFLNLPPRDNLFKISHAKAQSPQRATRSFQITRFPLTANQVTAMLALGFAALQKAWANYSLCPAYRPGYPKYWG